MPAPPNTSDSEYLAPSEYAAHFGVDKSTVIRHCREGDIRAVRVGNQWRILRSEIHEREAHLRREFWDTLPDALTPQQILDLLPNRFADLTAVHRAIQAGSLVAHLGPRGRTGTPLLVATHQVRRYAEGKPQINAMFTTAALRKAVAALEPRADASYANAAPTFDAAFVPLELSEQAEPETDEWGTPTERPTWRLDEFGCEVEG